jgi:DNA-binding transcriptional LysR family regulator
MPGHQPLDQRVLRRLKLRDLRVLAIVAESGSMGKGAAELAISQPAVSKAIAELELTLGVPLLDRSAYGVEPTLYGRALIKWGVAAFDDLRQGLKEIEFLSDPAAGEVRIGSTEAMTAGLVPAAIDRLSRRFPRIMFHVMQAPTLPLQYRDLRERRVDLILGRMVTPAPGDDLNVEVLIDDPLFVVAGGDNPWLRRRNVDAAALVGEPWALAPSDEFAGERVADAFRARGLEVPRRTVTSTSIQLFNALLATGRFLAVLSGSTLALSGPRLGLRRVRVDLPIKPGPVGVVTLKDRTVTPAAKLFIDEARKIAKPLSRQYY